MKRDARASSVWWPVHNAAAGHARSRLLVPLFVRLLRPVVRSAARAALEGRRRDPHLPQAGRFLRADVDAFLDDVWQRVPDLLQEDEAFERLDNVGNRLNVILSAITIAAYHALLERGIERGHAMTLFADVGWKVYERMLKLPYFIGRWSSRDPQRRMDFVLEALLRFPFSASGAPGYEVSAWSEPKRFFTYFTQCAPLGFVERYVARHGDRGELDAFYQSWCLYDWPAADVLAGGRAGVHYRRLHTLSRGDAVCDMCWSATCADGCTAANGA